MALRARARSQLSARRLAPDTPVWGAFANDAIDPTEYLALRYLSALYY